MKIINNKSIAATLVLAAGIIPAFGQPRGRGSERGSERGGHSQFQRESPRGQSFRNRAVPQSRGDVRQYGGNAFRNESGPRREYNSRGNGFVGTRHYVIPQNRFYRSFGREHYFRIGRPVFHGPYARFQYGGFWFNFAAAAPAYWGPDWYNSDDVYIDYSDGGYYLYDNRYPGQGVPLEVDSGDGSAAPADGAYDGSYDDGYGGSYPGTY